LGHGMCNQVFPAGELETVVQNKANKIAEGAPLAQASAKRILRQMGDMSFSKAIDLEAEIQEPLSETEDCQEAVAAFFRKEKPIFKGR